MMVAKTRNPSFAHEKYRKSLPSFILHFYSGSFVYTYDMNISSIGVHVS